MKKIELIEIDLENDLILPHPKQHELYGEEVLDEDFVESIKLQGVLQPPVVTYFKDVKDGFENHDYPKDAIVFISGHRRWKGSLKAGRVKLYCELKRYGNYFDSEVDHITYNKQRKKSKAQIAKELLAYKQKLDQVRKVLEIEGVEGVKNFNSFDFLKHVKYDENGKPYLPYATEMIEKDLGISKKHQEQLNVIFSDEWLQSKIEDIHFSKLSARKKKEATEKFSGLVESARTEVDKRDGLSINRIHSEIMRVWNDIDSVINPKPKEKAKKKKSHTKKWVKAKDFANSIEVSELEVDSPEAHITIGEETKNIVFLKGGDNAVVVNTKQLLKFLKEQGV
jgi:ParB-like chromosome segregation protein Spo0J